MIGIIHGIVTDLVDDDRAGEDEEIVLAVVDLDRVGVAQGDPAPGDRRHHPPSSAEFVAVVQEAPLRLVVVRSRDVDRERAPEQGEDVLADGGGMSPAEVDFVGFPQGKQFLPDEADGVSLPVAKIEAFPQQLERPAIHVEPLPAVRVLDGEVVAEAEDLFLDEVAHVREGRG